MELSDLTIFCAVVEMGGISPAAHALNRVPSNITSRVKKLEAELNTALFIREKNRLRPSPTGEQFFTHAKEILAMAESAILKINNTTPSGRLRLGSIEAVAASRLSNVLLDFHQTYTEVELEVTTSPTGTLIEQVIDGQLDLALVSDPPQDQRLQITPIFSETLVLVSSLLNEDINSPLDLGHNPTLLGFSTQCVYRTRLVDWVKQADILPKIVEINSYTALLNCVTAGMGVGFVPEKLLTVYPFKEGIKTHPLPTMIGSTTTNLIWRKDSVKSSMEAFKSTLIATSNI
ncbi:LysR family transcriptional regulator [Moritella viscosa]|uniref:Transcriptional regulator LYSR-type n=1 Tax=Moritella viscosa TaxID=80854 RepID=A0ABY1HFZ1_9GAMM|nr:LysR family transcriptional regulator [Moritella viscosa]CED60813.1 transcriptional regulator, LysR-family [Moritella viscosa]SGY96284.1 Putative transcriptional regulator LYSR-type [Moritella viscosa]SGZ02336.1 Putative transcriptional regulator LYSR-type [Moritella viscosa]SGZ08861.1 Putative transcriptional regulator LYSR-type [Moritella viscosa]SHO10629.1 Putative transcriptional regulator LYSR-type [Moritella viscosa]